MANLYDYDEDMNNEYNNEELNNYDEDYEDDEQPNKMNTVSEKEIDDALNDDEEDDGTIKQKKVVYYCPEYDDIHLDRNKVWDFYTVRIKKTLGIMSYWKNFDREELFQQAFVFYVDLCKIYIPYYNGKFYPFDRYLFKNLIIKLRAYIQNYYLKNKREQPTEFSERTLSSKVVDDIKEIDNKILVDQMYDLMDERQKDILDYTYRGYKQQEVGEILDISQSRVSVIKKKALVMLKDFVTTDDIR